MNFPKIIKVVLNMGFNNNFNDKKKLDFAFNLLKNISCQKPIFIKSKKSISNFKTRKGDFIGLKVTLRKKNMYNFLYKFFNIVLKKLNRKFNFKFDKKNNFNFGISDLNFFPEVYFLETFDLGLNINININSKSKEETLFILKKLFLKF